MKRPTKPRQLLQHQLSVPRTMPRTRKHRSAKRRVLENQSPVRQIAHCPTSIQPMQALLILACDRHAGAITQLLDSTGISNWVALPATQARRQGFLQYMPPRHPHGNYAIMGFAESKDVIQALQMLAEGVLDGGVCPDCVAYVWATQQVSLSHAALDPVCEKVVNREQALTATHENRTYHFCSSQCRAVFLERPEPYVQWKTNAQRLGRRELTCGGQTGQMNGPNDSATILSEVTRQDN